MTDLPGHDGKVMSDKKIIYIKGIKVELEIIAAIFSVIFEETNEFLI